MHFCRTICLWPQNTPQFLISLLHWSQISFPGAFFWGLQTVNSHWRPDLENRMGVEVQFMQFCCVERVANNVLNHQHVVFDRLWANATPTLNTAFSLTNVHAKWWIHCLLISSTPLLTHTTSIYDRPKQVFGVFRDNCWIWATWTFSIINVCKTAFKVSIPPLNCCFQWSRVGLTLIKPLLCSSGIFSPHQKTMLYQHTKFSFHCFENLQQ